MASAAPLLSVSEAQAIVLGQARPLPPATVPLLSALGHVLAAGVRSDLDSPPHDRAMMDGYAVRCADLADGRATLDVVEEVTAGNVPRLPVGAGQAARIMTGAPVPAGADAVVMVERTQALADGRVRIEDRPPRPGQHVQARASELRAGEVVLAPGTLLRPQEVGLLALVGRAEVPVVPRPGVHVLATGDELVPPDAVPGPGQIRNSNGPMLVAQARRAGGEADTFHHAGDDREQLRRAVEAGRRSPVLLLSGGVSAGKLDLVPEVLAGLGVRIHFHRIAMKPGKPLLFGTAEADGGATTYCFGLPGNPVSSFVCFELFVRPLLRRLRGLEDVGPPLLDAVLAADLDHRSDRPTYRPALLERRPEGRQVRAVPWFGSPDLRGLCAANALAVLPPGEHQYRAGQAVPVIPLDGEWVV